MPPLSSRIGPFLHRAKFAFLRGVGISHSGDRLEPIPPPHGSQTYEGLWIAVVDGKIVAVAETSTKLAYEVFKLGPRAADAVMQRVQKPSDRVLVGMG